MYNCTRYTLQCKLHRSHTTTVYLLCTVYITLYMYTVYYTSVYIIHCNLLEELSSDDQAICVVHDGRWKNMWRGSGETVVFCGRA